VFVDAGVDAAVYVHDLGDLEVNADAGQRVGVVGGEVLGLGKKGDCLPDGLLHSLVEVLVYAGDYISLLGLTSGVVHEGDSLLVEIVLFV
jgi:hypothetical protein